MQKMTGFYRFVLISVMWQCLLLEMAMVSGVQNYSRADFPADFVFGAGSSAYQVEGAAFEDGRKASIWDTFVHSDTVYARKTFNGATGDVACDQYHKYKEDVQLMDETGLEGYRFSISWSRLIPDGNGPVNPKGLQYYNNLINELVKHGIKPYATLYHFDFPQSLEDEYGGWLSRNSVRDFTNFADVCFKEFGDRVSYWTTLNEANAMAMAGYDTGHAPPGRCSSPFWNNCNKGNSSTEPYIAAHNILLAHSSVANLYNRKYKAVQHGFVGLNFFANWFSPKDTNSEGDVNATKTALDYFIGWFLHPLVFGDYPETVKKNAGTRLPVFTKQEVELLKGSFDFIALNHYSTIYIKDNPDSFNMKIRDLIGDMGLTFILNFGPSDEKEVDSSGLYNILQYLKTFYGNPPTYIHENGIATVRNGTLDDESRVKYMQSHIGTLLDALRNGVNMKGYFMWSFLDGFEVLSGYRTGFGLYYVDLNDKQMRRYPKLAAHWYSNFLKGRIGIQNADPASSVLKASQ